MDPHIATAVLLVLSLALILIAYLLGVEAGGAAKLQNHPGYEATRASLVPTPETGRA